MLGDEARERYLRHIILKEIGAQGQQKLLSARVLIVGAGGLGAPLVQYLAAAGVGVIGIADADTVALSNLQRQVIFRDEDIGASKAARAREFALALNPDIRIVAHNEAIDCEIAAARVAGYDFIVEGVDNFETRFALNAAAIAARKPLISAAIGRFEGQLSVFKPWAGPALPCYRCLVPEAPPREERLNCAEEGVVGPLAGVLGSMAALETLKEILAIGESLAGRLAIFDGLAARMRTIALPRDPTCPDCANIERSP
jgi:adenylyltransferase/sulfurtransferase